MGHSGRMGGGRGYAVRESRVNPEWPHTSQLIGLLRTAEGPRAKRRESDQRQRERTWLRRVRYRWVWSHPDIHRDRSRVVPVRTPEGVIVSAEGNAGEVPEPEVGQAAPAGPGRVDVVHVSPAGEVEV